MRKHIKSVVVTLLIVGVLVSMFAFAPAAFAAEDQSITLETVISLTDHPDSFVEDYTVVLEAEKSSNPMPSGSQNGVYEKTRTGAGTIELGTIRFAKPGIYNYTLSQIAGDADRWTYDSSVYNVIVYATNKEEGEGLNVNVAIYKEGEENKTDEIIFINEYDPLPASVSISATKTMDGKVPENGAFEFILEDADGNEIETVSNSDSAVSFTDLVFEEVGTYTYYVYEVKGDNKNITYDKTKYTVIIEVTKNGDFVAAETLKKGDTVVEELEFKNKTYVPPLGDNVNLGLWIGIFVASAAAIVCLLIFGRKRNNKE